jgi:putative nucleotidyltransferase with HDIG domain
MISAAEVTARIKKLPAFAELPARLAALMANPNSGVDEFDKAIKPDPGTTANLLRLANSAYFGLSRRIGTAREAISILGLKRVYDVAALTAVQRALPDRLPGYELTSKGYWQHCVAVAVLSEGLARAHGGQPPALAFTAGLMHDIGKLVLGEFLSLHAAEVLARMRSQGVTLINAEREVLGVDHGEIGFELARAWHLPEVVAAVIRWHHDPERAPDGPDRACVDLVHVGDALAHSMGFGADVGELHRPLMPNALDRLHLAKQALERAAGGALADIEDLMGLHVARGEKS